MSVRSQSLNQAGLELVERMADAVEYRDDATGRHVRQVARTATLIASSIGIDDDSARMIGRAAMIHDVGKVAVSDRILLKPARLTADEAQLMRMHVTIGGAILAGSDSQLLRMAEQIALTHHEWWDGTGYAAGLCGEQIPLLGRIVAIADVFDALTHERPYKPAWPVSMAVEEIVDLSGRQFDPELVDAFVALEHDQLV